MLDSLFRAAVCLQRGDNRLLEKVTQVHLGFSNNSSTATPTSLKPLCMSGSIKHDPFFEECKVTFTTGQQLQTDVK